MASSTSFDAYIISNLELSIFPLKDGTKQPLGNWETPYNGEQNYAIRTDLAGLLVLDLDNHGVVDGLETFKQVFGELPETFTVKTPHGMHLYFKCTEFGRHPGLWAGVDVLGGKGYVVGPGAVVDGRTYEIINDAPVAELPVEIRDIIRAKLNRKTVVPVIQPGWAKTETFKPRTLEECAEEVASADKGTRNNTLNAVAYYAFQRFEADEVFDQLGCAAVDGGQEHSAVSATLASAYSRVSDKGLLYVEPEPKDEVLSSWEPWNPEEFWEHGREDVEMVCAVDDDYGLFYRGKTNTVIAESEAGKSWLGLYACAQEIKAGNDVMFIDFEDDGPEIYSRLDYLVTREEARKHFSYIRPEEPIPAWFIERYVTGKTLVVIDGYGEALTLHALKQDDEGVLTFNRKVSRPMSLTGAAVVHLDHFPKATDNQKNAFGSVYKKNTVSGASYALRNKEPFGKDREGYSVLEVFKDRPGQVRAYCEREGNDFYAAELHIKSNGTTDVFMTAPTQNQAIRVNYKKRVSDYMATAKRSNKEGLKKAKLGKAASVVKAADELVQEGCLSQDGRELVFVKAYREPF